LRGGIPSKVALFAYNQTLRPPPNFPSKNFWVGYAIAYAYLSCIKYHLTVRVHEYPVVFKGNASEGKRKCSQEC